MKTPSLLVFRFAHNINIDYSLVYSMLFAIILPNTFGILNQGFLLEFVHFEKDYILKIHMTPHIYLVCKIKLLEICNVLC